MNLYELALGLLGIFLLISSDLSLSVQKNTEEDVHLVFVCGQMSQLKKDAHKLDRITDMSPTCQALIDKWGDE